MMCPNLDYGDRSNAGHALGKYLVVNADDFGLSEGVNAGIMRACQQGIVTSASLMVRQVAAAAAAKYGTRHPDLSLGLHLDFAEWTYEGGEWRQIYEVVDVDNPVAVAREADDQLRRFRSLTGRNPTHLDSHQHLHRTDPVRTVALHLARELGVPLRHLCSVNYCGSFYGQDNCGQSDLCAISSRHLAKLISQMPLGLTELACHPGLDDNLPTMYGKERGYEVDALCSDEVRLAITDSEVQLVSFAEAARLQLLGREVIQQ